MRTIQARIGNMRRTMEWVVYPRAGNAENDDIIIQCNSRIASFDPNTGKGLLSKPCPNGAYFLHLNKAFGAVEIEVPTDVIALCQAVQPQPGDEIAPGIIAR